MTIYVDIPSRTVVDSASLPRPTDSISLKRGDCLALEVVFLVNGTPTDLATGATGTVGLKESGDYSGNYLASASSWTWAGAGTGSYTFSGFNLNTTEINSLFSRDQSDAPAILEIEWVEGSYTTRSNTVPVDLQNNVNQGDEGVPTDGNPPYPLPNALLTTSSFASEAQAVAGTDNSTVMTPLRTAEAMAATVPAILTVPNQAARMALTSSQVKKGDQVMVLSGATVVLDANSEQDWWGQWPNPAACGIYQDTDNPVNGYPSYSNGPYVLYYSTNVGAWVIVIGTTPLEAGNNNGPQYVDQNYSTSMGANFNGNAQDMNYNAQAGGNVGVSAGTIGSVGTLYEVLDVANLANDGGWANLGHFELPPQIVASPVVSGTSTLEVSQGTWDRYYSSLAYQWQVSADGVTWTNISGATSATYSPTSAEANQYLRCAVTATNGAGSAVAYSGAIQLIAPVNTTVPSFFTTPAVGFATAINVGVWSNFPASYTYQWEISADGTTWTSISGATGPTYSPVSGDVGSYLRCVVTAANVAGSSSAVSQTSAQITVTTLMNGLVAYWKLNETSGTRQDATGNSANELSVVGTVGSAAGIISNAATFGATAGGGTFVQGGLNSPNMPYPEDGSISLTFSCWMKIAGGCCRGVGGWYTSAPALGLWGNTLYWSAGNDNGVNIDGSPYFGAWHNFVGTYDNGTGNMVLYIDGVSVGTFSVGGGGLQPGNYWGDFCIGYDDYLGDGQVFNGAICEVGIWTRVLNSTEISQLYNGGSGTTYPF